MPKTAPLLLDLFPNAAAAYSLRKLRTAYSGSAIRVRRSSDNTEQDIGFVGNNLDTASLLTFCGAGNGFVTTWYDQSGNGNNATQSTAGNQPIIVSSGAILTDVTTGNYSVRFQNAGLNMTSSVTLVQQFIASFVMQRVASSTHYLIGGTSSSLYMMAIGSTNNYLTNIGGGGATTLQNISGSVTRLLTINRDSSNVITGFNNGNAMTNTRTNSGNNTYNALGRINSFSTDGYISEAIWWNQNYLADRTAIETNINSHYNIYP
jgi:hypothetical protein